MVNDPDVPFDPRDLWMSDGSHPSEYGTYLAANVIMSPILGVAPTYNYFHPLNIKDYDAVYLQEMAATRPGIGAELALADLIREEEGESKAADFLAEQLTREPSLTLLLRSIELNARMPDSQSSRFLEGLRPHVRRLLEQKPLYQCSNCGFAAKTLHWQCPSCRHWSTIKRKAGCEAEI